MRQGILSIIFARTVRFVRLRSDLPASISAASMIIIAPIDGCGGSRFLCEPRLRGSAFRGSEVQGFSVQGLIASFF